MMENKARYCPVCLGTCNTHDDGSYSHWHYCEYESHEAMPALTEKQMLGEKIKRQKANIKILNAELRLSKKQLKELQEYEQAVQP